MLVGNLPGKLLVVGFVIIPPDPLLGHARGAAGFKDIIRTPLVLGGHPHVRLKVTQPIILKMRKARHEVRERSYFPARIPARLASPLEPERAAGFRRKMPLDDFAEVRIEFILRCFDSVFG